MFVKNNTLSMHRIALSGAFGHHIDLFPGVNTVEDAAWEMALQNSMVAWRVKAGEYEALKASTPITPALVKETYNPAVLDEFEKSKSKLVRKAVSVQKARLELTPEEKASARGRG